MEKQEIAMPEIRIWETATDLPGSEHQRKQYFCRLVDDEADISASFILIIGPGPKIEVQPYSPPDYDYTQYDGDYEDEDEYYDEVNYGEEDEVGGSHES